MVFGYYHITMRSVSPNEVPTLKLPAQGRICQKVKVGHLLWIPFIPLERVWVLEQGDKMFTINPEGINQIESKLGKKSAPWYSFLGFLLIGAFVVFSNIQSFLKSNASKNLFEETVATRVEQINNASTSDIFYFKGRRYKTTAIKVDKVTADSVRFLAPLDNEGKQWDTENWAAAFYAGQNPVQKITFAKDDLKKSFSHDFYESFYDKGMMAEGILDVESPVSLSKIETINGVAPMPFVSAVANGEVEDALTHFVENYQNLDSLVTLIDSASIEFYKKNLRTATMDDSKIVRMLRDHTAGGRTAFNIRNCLYEILLYTRYIYLDYGDTPALVNDKATVALDNLGDYMFFLMLMDKGFLHMDNKVLKGLNVNQISFSSENEANLNVSMQSNILQQPTLMRFSIQMHKENGRWKLNLPSTYSYTNQQIGLTEMTNQASKNWRKMVRDNLATIEKDLELHVLWSY